MRLGAGGGVRAGEGGVGRGWGGARDGGEAGYLSSGKPIIIIKIIA